MTAICDILGVTPESWADDVTGTSDKLAIKKLIDDSDPDTLQKIRNMLNKQ